MRLGLIGPSLVLILLSLGLLFFYRLLHSAPSADRVVAPKLHSTHGPASTKDETNAQLDSAGNNFTNLSEGDKVFIKKAKELDRYLTGVLRSAETNGLDFNQKSLLLLTELTNWWRTYLTNESELEREHFVSKMHSDVWFLLS